jgi:hypothetical protein
LRACCLRLGEPVNCSELVTGLCSSIDPARWLVAVPGPRQRPRTGELSERADAIGPSRFTLPWGICVAAESFGLHTTFISEQPRTFLESSYADVAAVTGTPSRDVRLRIDRLLERCRTADHVTLLEWHECHGDLPQILVKEDHAVVIPTLWWDSQPHNIVVTAFDTSSVWYHDPHRVDGADREMSIETFDRRWLHLNTDNDLLVISDRKLEV